MKPAVTLLLLASAACLAPAAGPFAFVTLDGRRIQLTENGRPVYVYNYGMILREGFPEEMSRSTYLHPVYAPDGTLITDDFNKDHPHHRGISWMWPVVVVDGKTYDIWTVQGMKQRFVRWTARTGNPQSATLGVENGWYIGDGRKVVRENVEIVTRPVENGRRQFDFTLRLEATGEPVEIAGTPDGNKGFGGFCFRLAPRDGGSAKTVITTDHGVIEKDGVLERTAWAAVSGAFQGNPESARLEDDPANPGYPRNGWLLRHGFGFMNPSWPGLEHFTLKPGAPLTLRYHVILSSGVAQ